MLGMIYDGLPGSSDVMCSCTTQRLLLTWLIDVEIALRWKLSLGEARVELSAVAEAWRAIPVAADDEINLQSRLNKVGSKHLR